MNCIKHNRRRARIEGSAARTGGQKSGGMTELVKSQMLRLWCCLLSKLT